MEKWSGIRITAESSVLPIGRSNHNTTFQWNHLITFADILDTEWHANWPDHITFALMEATSRTVSSECQSRGVTCMNVASQSLVAHQTIRFDLPRQCGQHSTNLGSVEVVYSQSCPLSLVLGSILYLCGEPCQTEHIFNVCLIYMIFWPFTILVTCSVVNRDLRHKDWYFQTKDQDLCVMYKEQVECQDFQKNMFWLDIIYLMSADYQGIETGNGWKFVLWRNCGWWRRCYMARHAQQRLIKSTGQIAVTYCSVLCVIDVPFRTHQSTRRSSARAELSRRRG